MGWDVAEQVAEVNYDFKKAIPAESQTWVRIDKVRPGANAIMEASLSEATLVYKAGTVEQRQTVHWEQIKFTACWLTLIETNLERKKVAYFPKRKNRWEEVSKGDFAKAWNMVLPTAITDEWMAAVLDANPGWYDMLRLWIPLWWLREYMPEKLEVVEVMEDGDDLASDETPDGEKPARKTVKKERAAKGESLGEDFSE